MAAATRALTRVVAAIAVVMAAGAALLAPTTAYAAAPAHPEIVATIPVGDAPLAVKFSPDGSVAYVMNRSSMDVSVIDTATRVVIGTVAVGALPQALAVSPDGLTLYVAERGTPAVAVVDTATLSVTSRVVLSSAPTAMTVSPDGTTLYLPGDDGLIAVVDTAAGGQIDSIDVGDSGRSPSLVVFSPDGAVAYVSGIGFSGDQLKAIDTTSRTVVATADVENNYPLAISPDGSRLYLAVDSPDRILVIDAARLTTVGSIPSVERAFVVATSPDGRDLYALTTDGMLRVFDTATLAPTADVAVDAYPVGLAASPDGSTLYVLDNGRDVVNVVGLPVAPAITSGLPPTTATVGSAYSFTVTASGFPAPSFVIASGALPDGLVLTAAGVLEGTPTRPGAATFTIVATNGVDPDALSDPITITVAAAPIPPAPATSTLAATGADPVLPLVFATAILALGAGLVVRRRTGRRL
jgi:YVTN family beta-propeller protein